MTNICHKDTNKAHAHSPDIPLKIINQQSNEKQIDKNTFAQMQILKQ